VRLSAAAPSRLIARVTATASVDATPSSALDGQRLFERARRDDTIARERLIEHFMPMARRLGMRYARARDTREDVAQVAYLGLIKAVDRFDASRGVPFESYAVPTIVGELKRWFRDTSWAMHLPRQLQERCAALELERARLAEQLGRTPTPKELAQALELDVEQVLETIEASYAAHTDSLDGQLLGADDASSYHDVLGCSEPGFELVDDRATIAPALAGLSRRERLVLKLRFVDDLTQREMGERLGVSQMQVSRLLRRTLARVRDEAESASPPAGP
jgi:RNA polymerase sigma-B factor